MAAAAILKFTLMATTRSLLNVFAQNLAQRQKNTSRKQFYLQFSHLKKIQDGVGHHFEILFNGHNPVIFEHIRTKFGIETRNNVQKTVLLSYFTS